MLHKLLNHIWASYKNVIWITNDVFYPERFRICSSSLENLDGVRYKLVFLQWTCGSDRTLNLSHSKVPRETVAFFLHARLWFFLSWEWTPMIDWRGYFCLRQFCWNIYNRKWTSTGDCDENLLGLSCLIGCLGLSFAELLKKHWSVFWFLTKSFTWKRTKVFYQTLLFQPTYAKCSFFINIKKHSIWANNNFMEEWFRRNKDPQKWWELQLFDGSWI